MLFRSTVVATLFLLPLLASAEAPGTVKPQYEVKESVPMTGSLIAREVARLSSSLPINLPWASLTREQQAQVRSQYVRMPATDEPPFPLTGTAGIFNQLADAQQVVCVSGFLDMAVRVDPNGKAVSVDTFSSPSEQLTRFISSVLIREKYKPAVCGGNACVMEFPLRSQLSCN
ncbi:MAG: hypothetical protein ABIT83_23370 [Massilia sp.]